MQTLFLNLSNSHKSIVYFVMVIVCKYEQQLFVTLFCSVQSGALPAGISYYSCQNMYVMRNDDKVNNYRLAFAQITLKSLTLELL